MIRENYFEKRNFSWPGRIFVFQELVSTNKYLLDRVLDYRHLDVIMAVEQSAGRGTYGRSWFSQAGKSLSFSLLIELDLVAGAELPIASLTQVMSLGLVEFLESFKVKANLKWPNDVQVNRLKIAGVLSELCCSVQASGGKQIVVGMGVNLNQQPDDFKKCDFKATSLKMITGTEIAPVVFLERFMVFVFPYLEIWLRSGFGFFTERFEKSSDLIGRKVRIRQGNEEFSVTVRGINSSGFLEVEREEESLELLTFGEIVGY